MNYEALKEKLKIKQGKVTISHQTLTQNVSTFLTAYYSGEPIVITNAEAGPENGENGTVVISGTSSFLNVANLPVTACFSVDKNGNAQALLKYQLRSDGIPGPKAWTFSRSFSKLPVVVNYGTDLPANFDPGKDNLYASEKPFVDALYLFDTYYVVSTGARQEPEFQVPLKQGINFISKMRPQGMLGVLEHSLGNAEPLTLYGPIRIPKPTDKTLSLKPLERVWDRSNAPGINLQAPLDLDFKMGKIAFNQARLRVYSPPSTDWQKENDSFQPIYGYAGKLSIPSADIEIDLDADLTWGIPAAQLRGTCEGVTLGKLTQLLDISGSDGLTASLPEEIQEAVEKLESLELMEVTLDVSLAGKVPTVNGVSFTIGMPNLNWNVWDGHFEMKSISCRFDIDNPFGKPSISVMVMGTMEIEGVPISIYAKSADNFTLYAMLEGKQTIPLQKLMKRYTPGVPTPSDLTIDSLMVAIAPGDYYAMSLAMAGKPNPWVISVGPSNLTISDVALDFTYPTGGSIVGSFAGTIEFGRGLAISIANYFPGPFAIRGNFPQVKLSQLIGKLCNQKVGLPGKFDLTFEHSSVLIQKQGTNYVFQFATQVENVGSFAFEARKVSGNTWGFAGGMAITSGSPSKLPGLSALNLFEGSFKLQKFLLVVSFFDSANFQFPDMAQFNNPAITSQGNIALPAQSGGLTAGTYIFAEWRIDTKDKQQKLLKKLLGLSPTLGVTLYLGKNPAADMRLFVKYSTKLNGHPMICQFGVMLQNRKPAMFLDGQMTVKIQKKPVTFAVTMLFAPTGALLTGTMKGTVNFNGLKLSNAALMIVAPWSGIPSLGIAATISTKRFSSSVALFFDTSNPSRSVLAGSVSDLTLKDVAEELSRSKLPAGIGNVLGSIGVEGTNAFTMPGSVSKSLDDLDVAKVSQAFKTKGKVTIPSSASRVLLVVGKKGSSWHLTDMANNMRHYPDREARADDHGDGEYAGLLRAADDEYRYAHVSGRIFPERDAAYPGCGSDVTCGGESGQRRRD